MLPNYPNEMIAHALVGLHGFEKVEKIGVLFLHILIVINLILYNLLYSLSDRAFTMSTRPFELMTIDTSDWYTCLRQLS